MSMQLMYITNNPLIAQMAEASGVDRVWVDMEWMGKDKRQGGMDTVQSHHTLEDISTLRPVISKSKLMVRVNPIHDHSKEEIDETIKRGGEIIMLPMWKTVDEVKKFVEFVDDRAVVNLLLETPEAELILPQVLELQGIDEIHIGLNDLHLAKGMKFMFQLLQDGTVDKICSQIKSKGIPFGFGGIGRMERGTLPADHILGEHYRLGSTRVILSRTFCNTTNIQDPELVQKDFMLGVQTIRAYEKLFENFTQEMFEENHKVVCGEVDRIVSQIQK